MPACEKRQRRPKPTRSKSVVDTRRKAGIGQIDITNCVDDEEARKCLDTYWEPPELGVSKPTSRRITKAPPSPDPLQDGKITERRHSISSFSPGASTTSNGLPNQTGFTSSSSLHRAPATPESLFQNEAAQPETREESLENSLAKLFMNDKHADPPVSTSKQALIEARKAKADAERLEKIIEKELQAFKDRRLRSRLHRQGPRKELVEPLDPSWDAVVSNAQCAHPGKSITTSLEGTELRLKDFNTLLGQRSWLNDEIINTYIEWVVAAANEAAAAEAKAFGDKPSTVPKFIAHNSFFYANLKTKGPSSTDRLMKRKKAPGASLMEVDTVFVPICQGAHWTLGVVRPFAKTIEYFDSMGGHQGEFMRLMRGWLKHQLGSKYKDEDWTVPDTDCAIQTNGWDCGVFVCTNAFCVASGIDTECYRQEDMTIQRRRIAAILINRGFTKDFQWGQEGLLPPADYLQLGEGGLEGYRKQFRKTYEPRFGAEEKSAWK